MRITTIAALFFVVGSGLSAQANDAHSSKSPPAGPPWVTDFVAARATAIAEQKPIFVYSTKTY